MASNLTDCEITIHLAPTCPMRSGNNLLPHATPIIYRANTDPGSLRFTKIKIRQERLPKMWHTRQLMNKHKSTGYNYLMVYNETNSFHERTLNQCSLVAPQGWEMYEVTYPGNRDTAAVNESIFGMGCVSIYYLGDEVFVSTRLAPVRQDLSPMGRGETEAISHLSPQEWMATNPLTSLHTWILRFRSLDDIPRNRRCSCMRERFTRGCMTGTCYLTFFDWYNDITIPGVYRRPSVRMTKEWTDETLVLTRYSAANVLGDRTLGPVALVEPKLDRFEDSDY